MTKEVMKKEETALATYTPQASGVLKSDLVIPKVLLMQGLSDFVAERKAIMGDMVRSTNAEKLGDDKNPLLVIPLTLQNTWLVSEDQQGNGKYEFRRYEPRNAANEMAEWDYLEGGTKWKRTKVMTLFALLPKDIEAEKAMLAEFNKTGELPDVDKVLLPVAIAFKNTSFKAGRDISTIFAKADSISRQIGREVPVYGSMLKLSCISEKNDKGNFFVFKAETAGKAPSEYREVSESWYKTLKSNEVNIKLDETGEEKSTDEKVEF